MPPLGEDGNIYQFLIAPRAAVVVVFCQCMCSMQINDCVLGRYVSAFREFAVPQIKQLINAICLFFERLCDHNIENQKLLSGQLPLFKHLAIDVDGIPCAVPLITAILNNNPSECSRFDKNWLRKEIQAQLGADSRQREGFQFRLRPVLPDGTIEPFNVEWIRLLKALVSCCDPTNSAWLLHLIDKHTDVIWICRSDKAKELREKLILGTKTSGETTGGRPGVVLDVYLESINLLTQSLAAKGANSGLVRAMLPYHKLIDGMLDHTLPEVRVGVLKQPVCLTHISGADAYERCT